MSYKVTNISTIPLSGIQPGKSIIVEREKDLVPYQKFIQTNILSVKSFVKQKKAEVKKKETTKQTEQKQKID